jgi:peptidoglycan hydrolase-like protein with peptidoglycan-binding domain
MVYPAVLYNPQRPNAGFTHQGGGVYLTPDGGTVDYDTLMSYIYTAAGYPPAEDVVTAQLALNKIGSSLGRLNVNGVLNSQTAARIAEFQVNGGMIPTGVPDVATLEALAEATTGGGGASGTSDLVVAGVVLALVGLLFKGGE